MLSSVDCAPAKLHGLLVGEVPSVALVEDTVGEGGTRSDREDVALEARAVRVDVEEGGALRNQRDKQGILESAI